MADFDRRLIDGGGRVISPHASLQTGRSAKLM
jgi:hypothetical protein